MGETYKWISAKAAYAKACKALGTELGATELLDHYLETYHVKGRAEAISDGRDFDTVKPQFQKSDSFGVVSLREPGKGPYDLAETFWRDSSLSGIEPRLRRWEDGIFINVLRFGGAQKEEVDDKWYVELPRRTVAYGVEVTSDDLDKFLEDRISRIKSEKRPGRTRSEGWNRWYAELVAYYYEEGFDKNQSVNGLVKKMDIHFSGESPVGSTAAESALKVILGRLRRLD